MQAGSGSRSHTQRWAYRFLYTEKIFALTSRLVPLAGHANARKVSRAVASFYASTQPGVLNTVLDNLRLLDPSLGLEKAREVFLNYATCIADYVTLSSLPLEKAAEFCGEFTGKEHLAEAASSGGAILATGHFGFFEFGTVMLAMNKWPVTAATLAEPSPELTAWRASWRGRWGAETVEIGTDPFSSLAVQKSLAAGRMTALLADRPMGGQGVPISLPGGKALFSTSPAVLSLLTRRPVIPVTVSLRPDGKYRVAAMPPCQTERVSHDARPAEVERCTRAIAKALVSEFRKDPTQWFQFVPCKFSG